MSQLFAYKVFLAVKAVYYAEYDHTQTTRSDDEVTMYFYLTQDVDSGEWTIVDNSGNVNWSEYTSTDESGNLAVGSAEEQIFSYLSELYNDAYSLYYDCLHYQMNNYTETTDGDKVTRLFSGRCIFSGKAGILRRTKEWSRMPTFSFRLQPLLTKLA